MFFEKNFVYDFSEQIQLFLFVLNIFENFFKNYPTRTLIKKLFLYIYKFNNILSKATIACNNSYSNSLKVQVRI